MRYYGEDYKQELKASINAVRESADSPSYCIPINNIEVSPKRYGLKNHDIEVARKASFHVAQIKSKLTRLEEVLCAFYGETDEISESIVEMTETINDTVSESTAALIKLSRMLKGVGEYSGKTITEDDIRSAGIDAAKAKEKAAKFWTFVIDTEIENDHVNEVAVKNYVDYIQEWEGSGNDLLREDYDRLEKIYDHYVLHRMDGVNDLREVDRQRVQNCVDVFEILNPLAKMRMDGFFSPVDPNPMEDIDVINRNITLVRFITYTTDPKYRDILIYYLGKTHINRYDESGVYNCLTNSISIMLTDDYDYKLNGKYFYPEICAAFFHEMGHCIDDLSGGFGDSTEGLNEIMKADLIDNMNNVANGYGLKLTQDQKDEVINFIVSPKNVNVQPAPGDPWDKYLPNWNDEQKYMFDIIRQHYGYTSYDYIGDEDPNKKINVIPVINGHGPIGKGAEYAPSSDGVGGITNNQIGGNTSGHYEKFAIYDKSIKSEKDIIKRLEKFDYWYYFGSMSSNVQAEFFADSFDTVVLGRDYDVNRQIFPSACDHYDKLIDKIYNDLPKSYKGIAY